MQSVTHMRMFYHFNSLTTTTRATTRSQNLWYILCKHLPTSET